MKKMFLLGLCLATAGLASAQKEAVDQANKLAGKFDKLPEARGLVQKAIQDPTTAGDARTYYVAGMVEMKNFENGRTMGAINPSDPSANPVAMGEELLNAYKYFLQALPLDSLPNAKGEVKPKYTKDIIGKLVARNPDFFQSALAFYDAKRLYPEAYECFMIFADMPDMAFLGKKAPVLPEADRAQSYFNAGLSAYGGNHVDKSAEAFKKARQMGYEDPNAYIYEIASWQALAQRDSTQQELAKARILEVAKAGYEKFGIEQPLFLNNLVNTQVQDEDYDGAVATVHGLLANNPDNANLYGLLGFIYDRADKDQLSVENYLQATKYADPEKDYETLVNAAKKIFRVGQAKYNEIEPSDRAGKAALKNDYFLKAKEITDKIKGGHESDSDLNYLVESIDYSLDTFFKGI